MEPAVEDDPDLFDVSWASSALSFSLEVVITVNTPMIDEKQSKSAYDIVM